MSPSFSKMSQLKKTCSSFTYYAAFKFTDIYFLPPVSL